MDSIIRPGDSAAPLTASAVIDCIGALCRRRDAYVVSMTQWTMSDSTYQSLQAARKTWAHYRPRQRRRRAFGDRQCARYLDLWEYNEEASQ